MTLADRIFGGAGTRRVIAYLAAKLAGAAVGAVAANLMYGLPAVTLSSHQRLTVGCGSQRPWPRSAWWC